MVIFAFCLLCAGAILSLITRVHGLVAVALGVVISLVLGAFFLSFEAAPTYPLGVTFIVAIVALQVGYGLGVVSRAALDGRLDRATSSTARKEIRPAKQQLGRES
ncbi:hypothetical protein [Methylobacterium brachythecii]|uniref:Membrane-bound ClpP family serine protease n=1 Tax=Methylobacterium brachythecii TaxID=1176177 RepID=A0A7W6F813_9HYPH|nr:hypothetical protein [Methylobacterium brachythecii]MBB3903920.1 membrane-bound ClpP family serine protease [Methylobacterium brachythecii]GLS42667.1 hypothetical protein GCM10007884_06520 [Methylobacterium brachythecii]